MANMNDGYRNDNSRHTFWGRCDHVSCGEVLVSDTGKKDDAYFTKSEGVVAAARAYDLPVVKCPAHGGDDNIPIGSQYHPSHWKGISRENVLCEHA
jgi:hypothetical protein